MHASERRSLTPAADAATKAQKQATPVSFGISGQTFGTNRPTSGTGMQHERKQRIAHALPQSGSPESDAIVLQSILAERAPKMEAPGTCERAVAELEACGGQMDIGTLAERRNMSLRHLRRLFMREVGLSPKAFAKTIQFNRVVSALQSGRSDAMNQVALANGYYDQAHFVRDFSRFVGRNPSDFLAGEDEFLRFFLGRQPRD